MAHVNFKIINKLAKNGLVKGLPSKIFTNEHNCVACNKGNQHKASYKSITAVSTITEPLQLLHMDLFGPTSIRSIDHKYYFLVVTNDFSKVCWAFLSSWTKDETFHTLKDFITFIENQLNLKVKAIRCDNGTKFKNSKLIELCGKRTRRTKYCQKPHNKMGLLKKEKTLIEALQTMLADSKYSGAQAGHEWYFDLDYLTDTLGYTHFKANQPTSAQDTHINAGTQDDDSDSECDEQVIIVHSFPFNNFSGSKVKDTSGMKMTDSGYAEELTMLQRQEHEAKDAGEQFGFEFITDTEELLRQATIEARRNLDPAGSVPVPASSEPVHAAHTPLPPAHFTRYPNPTNLSNSLSSRSELEDIHHHPSIGIFSSSSYDDDFGANANNLAPTMDVNSLVTKRVNTIHPQSLVFGDPTLAVQTRSRVQKLLFGESAFVSYIHDQQRNNHTDYLHCLFACFLSQLEPSTVAQALEDLGWVDVMQEEMQQFLNQNVWKLVPLPEGKIAIGTK
ncbi:putative ribonuclease H-like domain-containing protein [Tanacetum coccineum]